MTAETGVRPGPERRRSPRDKPGGLGTRLGSLDVVICCGSGGVGKTTVSAALGMAIAAAEDKRVLVLTVDPARRLATALGIKGIGAEPVRIPKARLKRAGITITGDLDADSEVLAPLGEHRCHELTQVRQRHLDDQRDSAGNPGSHTTVPGQPRAG